MKYSLFTKAVALLLTACCLLAAGLCAVGIYACSELGLYNNNLEAVLELNHRSKAETLSEQLAYAYAARTYSDMPSWMLKNYSYHNDLEQISHLYSLVPGKWSYMLYDADKNLLESISSQQTWDLVYESFHVTTRYLAHADGTGGDALSYMDGDNVRYLKWQRGPDYYVTVMFSKDAFLNYPAGYRDIPTEYLQIAESWRYRIILILLGALVLGTLCVVYLCCAAGRSRKLEGICPGGLNLLPLDLYGVLAGFLCFAGFFAIVEGLIPRCFDRDDRLSAGMAILTAIATLLWLLVPIGWCYALIAQIKAGHGYWWRRSVVGRILGLIWKGIAFICRSVGRLINLLPMVGRRLLAIGSLLLGGLLTVLFFGWNAPVLGALLLLALSFWSLVLFGYDTFCFGTLMSGARRMAEGDLTCKIPTKYLTGSYREHALRLNTIADVATEAASRRLKSERMKTELITNVSHDIKTPLTSIINYVDLLQKPHTEEEQQQYLEVLERQSLRMKKLLEDLMDMSKASTGNMAVEIVRMDAAEAVNQALGEFADKLDQKALTPVVTCPEGPVWVQADGRLTWRVLSNLLSNTVKYTLSGTRVYVTLTRQENRVLLSIKNISREALNITADELTERFVRGDAARNTEGSGLGLNIAKSLMELQKGSLDLTVDGDLFKVILTFPSADGE